MGRRTAIPLSRRGRVSGLPDEEGAPRARGFQAAHNLAMLWQEGVPHENSERKADKQQDCKEQEYDKRNVTAQCIVAAF